MTTSIPHFLCQIIKFAAFTCFIFINFPPLSVSFGGDQESLNLFQSAINPFGMTDEKFGTLQYLEPCDLLLDKSGDVLFVLNAESRDLRKISLIDKTPPQILTFNDRPNRMTFSPDQTHIAIVAGEAQGVLLWVNAQNLTLEK
ncbi:MAG: hypothetical protein LBT05_02280 [Planctomycetaceae bacterium]|jgi:hypothetical protein|nr:hypothetical protein [Planctomycetaceae bacterium]